MIDRYKNTQMSCTWSELTKFRYMALLSAAWIEAQTGIKVYAGIDETDLPAIVEYEKETKHETTAFLKLYSTKILKVEQPYLHRDLTSSDLLDTVLYRQLAESQSYVYFAGMSLANSMKPLLDSKTTIIARTHGQPAAKIPLRHRIDCYLTQLYQTLERFETNEFRVGKLRGPVGQGIHPITEEQALKIFGAKPFAGTCSQILPRGPIANLVADIAILGRIIAKIGLDIRLMASRGEVRLKNRGDSSSSMPWKTNPSAEEKLEGLSRLLDSYVPIALANIQVWEERDMSHSSNERIYLPDMFHTICHMIETLRDSLASLEFADMADAPELQPNINHFLDQGLSRPEALATAKKTLAF